MHKGQWMHSSNSMFALNRRALTLVSACWSAGRLLIAQGAVDACKIGVSIAIRYSCKRPQFGEKMIMEYITQQRRLLPGLATTYAMQIAMRRLRVSLIKDDVLSSRVTCLGTSCVI